MANSKTIKSKKTVTKEPFEYIYQHFGPKSLALIHKYNLQTDENYKKIISTYERIESLPNEDPRRDELISIWETEFNKLFKVFWEKYIIDSSKTATTGIEGWKNRLDVKPSDTSPLAKRQSLLSRLTTNTSATSNTKAEILSRAGFKTASNETVYNFSAEKGKSADLNKLEDLVSTIEETIDLTPPTSILSNDSPEKSEQPVATEQPKPKQTTRSEKHFNFSETKATGALYDAEGKIVKTSDDSPVDPYLKEFVKDTPSYSGNSKYVKEEKVNLISEPIVENKKIDPMLQNVKKIDIVDKADEEIEVKIKPIVENTIYDQSLIDVISGKEVNIVDPITDFVSDSNDIDPSKRNILSKEGMEVITTDKNKINYKKERYYIDKEDENASEKPYHEVKPIGYYGIKYDPEKRPSTNELIKDIKKEEVVLTEMTEKIDLLRELRDERRHRINMMKIERTNSFVIARARRLAEMRERRRLKKRDDLNYRAIERADRLRRLQERQKLISLMKERQMKRAEEKRIASVLRLERERRMEKDAKYRSELASIDSQIRHEQELIKRTELKMKAYFTKLNDERLFDESLLISKKDKLAKVEQKILKIEKKKREDRIEKISKKFLKKN